MDIHLSPEQLALRADVRAFLDEHYPPERILQMEQDEEYPDDFYRECAKRGWTGIPVPEERGGSDGSVLDLCVFVEEVGKTSKELLPDLVVRIYREGAILSLWDVQQHPTLKENDTLVLLEPVRPKE